MKTIERMDKGLHVFYTSQNLNGAYLNNDGVGKFQAFCDEQSYGTDDVREELAEEEEKYNNCGVLEFDQNFPHKTIRKERNPNQVLFTILKCLFEQEDIPKSGDWFDKFYPLNSPQNIPNNLALSDVDDAKEEENSNDTHVTYSTPLSALSGKRDPSQKKYFLDQCIFTVAKDAFTFATYIDQQKLVVFFQGEPTVTSGNGPHDRRRAHIVECDFDKKNIAKKSFAWNPYARTLYIGKESGGVAGPNTYLICAKQQQGSIPVSVNMASNEKVKYRTKKPKPSPFLESFLAYINPQENRTYSILWERIPDGDDDDDDDDAFLVFTIRNLEEREAKPLQVKADKLKKERDKCNSLHLKAIMGYHNKEFCYYTIIMLVEIEFGSQAKQLALFKRRFFEIKVKDKYREIKSLKSEDPLWIYMDSCLLYRTQLNGTILQIAYDVSKKVSHMSKDQLLVQVDCYQTKENIFTLSSSINIILPQRVDYLKKSNFAFTPNEDTIVVRVDGSSYHVINFRTKSYEKVILQPTGSVHKKHNPVTLRMDRVDWSMDLVGSAQIEKRLILCFRQRCCSKHRVIAQSRENHCVDFFKVTIDPTKPLANKLKEGSKDNTYVVE